MVQIISKIDHFVKVGEGHRYISTVLQTFSFRNPEINLFLQHVIVNYNNYTSNAHEGYNSAFKKDVQVNKPNPNFLLYHIKKHLIRYEVRSQELAHGGEPNRPWNGFKTLEEVR